MGYLVEVFWSDDDQGYIAVVPDLPGCSAFGDSRRPRSTRSATPPWPGSPPAARAATRFPNPRPKPAFGLIPALALPHYEVQQVPPSTYWAEGYCEEAYVA
jgi:hypothetical protein